MRLFCAAFRGIKSLVLHTPAAFSDPFPVRAGGTALLAQMMFESQTALDAALQSDARKQHERISRVSAHSTAKSRTKRFLPR